MIKKIALLGVAALGVTLAAPASARELYAPVSGSIPTDTPPSVSLACMRQSLSGWTYSDRTPHKPIRLAVADIPDRTGKFSYEATEGGSKVTQGAGYLAVGSLAELGPMVRQMNRLDTRVEDAEMKLAAAAMINDGEPFARKVLKDYVGPDGRVLTGGAVQGSDYVIHGAITGIDYNWRTNGGEVFVQNIGLGKRIFVLNVHMLTFLTDTKTYEVLATAKVDKQVYGQETKAGMLSFFGTTLVSLDAGGKSQEPIELGVSAAIDRSMVELVGKVTGADWQACLPEEFPRRTK